MTTNKFLKKSLCCKAPIMYMKWGIEGVWYKSSYWCTLCGGFPPASKGAIKKAMKLLKERKL